MNAAKRVTDWNDLCDTDPVMSILKNNTQSEYLNDLLTRAYDAEQGFKVAAENAENEALKSWFEANSKQRLTFGHQIKSLLKDLGVEPDKGASVSGKVHQAFMKVRAAITGTPDAALIEECQRGEKGALDDYQDALTSVEFRTDARKVLEDQAQYVQTQLSALDTISKSLVG